MCTQFTQSYKLNIIEYYNAIHCIITVNTKQIFI